MEVYPLQEGTAKKSAFKCEKTSIRAKITNKKHHCLYPADKNTFQNALELCAENKPRIRINMILYGIPNCDTVKKARKFLEENQIDYRFHDFKKEGLSQETIREWLKLQPIEILVNKRSTSWKQLTDDQKENLMNQSDLSVLTEMPTLIKRPVLVTDKGLLVGFKADEYLALK